MAKISITRALTEYKTLKKRISKEVTENLEVIAVQQGNKLRDCPYIEPEAFKERAISEMKKINDLYDRYTALKKAIDKSNYETKITVGKVEMTVQEAIAKKNMIDLRKDLLEKLKDEYKDARADMEMALRENDQKIDNLISQQTQGKNDKELKANMETARNYVNTTFAVSLMDPCDLGTLIKNLEEEIDDFEKNVDFALSEVNSTTFIDIPD